LTPLSKSRAALWRAVLHFDRSKARPWLGLRHTVGLVVPLIAAALWGQAANGMVAGLGALNVAVADGTDSYRHRARRMLMATLCCSLAVVVGALTGDTWWAPAILALGAFAAGMMVAAGSAPGDIGLITLVTLVVFSARPLPVRAALIEGVYAFGGGLFQTLLAISFWPLRGGAPERLALVRLFQALAQNAAEPLPATEEPPATRESTEAQTALAGLDARDSLDAERHLALLSQAERIRLGLLTLARLRVRLARETGGESSSAALQQASRAASDALAYTGEVLAGRTATGRMPDWAGELGHLARTLPAPDPAGPSSAAAAMISDARSQVHALAGQIRTVLDLSNQTTTRGLAEFEKRDAAHPWRLRFASPLPVLAANLRLASPAFRHALRLAVCVTAGHVLAHALGWRRPYWVPMTVVLVLKPDYTATFSRGVQRLLGTLIGLLIATGLVHLLHPSIAFGIVLVAGFAFLLRAYGPANYGIFAVGVTGLVVFLFAVIGVPPAEVVVPRGLNTLAGGFIALAAYWVWPTWERASAPEAVARMLEAYRAYFRKVREAYFSPEVDMSGALDRARLEARVARSDFEASLARMHAEPGGFAGHDAMYHRILADSHRFIRAVMSLEAGLYSSPAVPAREALRKLSDDVDFTLYHLAAGLLHGRPVLPSDLADLRADHNALLAAADSRSERHTLVNVETDRMVNSLNTLAGEVMSLIGGAESPAGPTSL
jgi:uncharacterized membrane protein YccC